MRLFSFVSQASSLTLTALACFACGGGGESEGSKETDAPDVHHHAPTMRIEPDATCLSQLETSVELGEVAAPFLHGVASGDPLTDRVVLWTRVTPDEDADPGATLEVQWEVAADAAFTEVVASDVVRTSGARDYTVKVDVIGLEPGTRYYYRFRAPGGELSVVGLTRTVGADPDQVRLAVAACASYQSGFFSSFRHLAMRDDLDAVMFLGDYVYEYGSNFYDKKIGRTHQPDTDAVTVADYRARYAQTRSDPDLRAAHQQHPFIAIWDDHEVLDDIWNEGAAKFQGTLAELEAQRGAGKQAYLEWLPVRETERDGHVSLYRHLPFGSLADLILVDARMEYRDESSEELADLPDRSLLGAAQERWLFDQLSASQDRGVAWRLFGSQVTVGQVEVPDWVVQYQTWNGFTVQRERLFDFAEEQRLEDIVVVSSDMHYAAALEVARDPFGSDYDPQTGAGALMTELMAGSLTAPTGQRFLDSDGPNQIQMHHPHYKYMDVSARGYMLLDVTSQRVRAEWYATDTVLERDLYHHVDRVFEVERGAPHLIEVQGEPGPASVCP